VEVVFVVRARVRIRRLEGVLRVAARRWPLGDRGLHQHRRRDEHRDEHERERLRHLRHICFLVCYCADAVWPGSFFSPAGCRPPGTPSRSTAFTSPRSPTMFSPLSFSIFMTMPLKPPAREVPT